MQAAMLRLLLAVLLLACLPNQSGAAAPAPISNIVLLHYDVAADGTYLRTLHLERHAATDTEAGSLAVFPWQYDTARGNTTIIAAYTLKADGRKLPADPASFSDQPASNSPAAPFPPTRRQKLIRFPGVTAGDSVVLDLREHVFQSLLPGVFSLALMFDRTQLWDVRATISLPAGMKLYADAAGPVASDVSDGADVTYAWLYHSTGFVPLEVTMLPAIERLPRLVVTTAASWQQIAHAYAAAALPQQAVTPRLDDTAALITHGQTDQRAVAERLYDWVRTSIGYLPVALGDSEIPPHTADTVLTTKQGDSADQAVLLAALLKAKGIQSELVLVPSDNLFHLTVPAPFSQLNHVLLYVPALRTYADTTAGSLPFGVLPFNEYGKPALYAVTGSDVLGAIPMLSPDAASSTSNTTAHLTADDMVVGDSRTEATGPFELALRTTAASIAADNAAQVAQAQSRALGQFGTARFDAPPADGSDASYALSGHFAVSLWPLLSADNRLTMPIGLRLLPRPGDFLIGPLDAPDLPASEPTPCFPGHQVSTVTLDLAPKYHVLQLPPDRKIANDAFSYESHWSAQGQALTVRREMISRVNTPLCSGRLRETTAAALRMIRQDYTETVALAPAQ
ncbi:MAG TPA: DUF3857 domain-containing protein [Acetobacteraceae bacterium]|nr:DUF3857 domain-containing protein [Acetobacteraceae bacterium]